MATVIRNVPLLYFLSLLSLFYSDFSHAGEAIVQNRSLVLNLAAARDADILISLVLRFNKLQFTAIRPDNCLDDSRTSWVRFFVGDDNCIWEMDWHEDGLVFGLTTCPTATDVEIKVGSDTPLLFCSMLDEKYFPSVIDLALPCNLTTAARRGTQQFLANFTIIGREEGSECDEILIRFDRDVWLNVAEPTTVETTSSTINSPSPPVSPTKSPSLSSASRSFNALTLVFVMIIEFVVHIGL